jgi:hypothetical protein
MKTAYLPETVRSFGIMIVQKHMWDYFDISVSEEKVLVFLKMEIFKFADKFMWGRSGLQINLLLYAPVLFSGIDYWAPQSLIIKCPCSH